VLSSLATSHKIGIAVVAGVFIVFALASSFLLPSLRPDFPGKRVGLYTAVTALLTAGMLAAVIALAGEPKEARGAEGGGESVPATPKPAPAPPPAPAAGDAAAGKSLFAAQGCSACHTFTPAGSKGTVGPDLDKLAADAAKANHGSVAQYAAESITDPNAYVVPGFPKGVMPTNFSSLSDKQVADLVAFITSTG
jgi:mono/diheme cytochrome c family protein